MSIGYPGAPLGNPYQGVVNVYKLDSNNFKQLGKFLWSQGFIDTLNKAANDPAQTILSCMRIPIDITNVGALTNVHFGNVIATDTVVMGNEISYPWQKKESPIISVLRPFNDYRDYMCQVSIYLPYVGEKPLNIQDVFSSSINNLQVIYNINVASGGCVAYVLNNSQVIGQFGGMCGAPIPVTSQNFGETLGKIGASVLSVAGNVVSAVATGGATALASAADIAGTITGAATGGLQSAITVNEAGGESNNAGFIRSPYLIIRKPRRIDNPQKKFFTGLPSGVGVTALSQCVGTGLVRTLDFKFSGSGCTDWEKSEIERILNNEGVIL